MATLADMITARFGIQTDAGSEIEADGVLKAILGRHSIRKYADTPIPDGYLEIILACAQSAPAKSDLQQYSIIVLDDPDTKAAVSALGPELWFADAPISLVFCGDMRRGQRFTNDIHGHAHDSNTVDTFMNAAVDGALAMQACTTAAGALGLGSCFISNVRKYPFEISEILGLPEGVYLIAGMGCGFPVEERDVALRLPPSSVVHHNRYNDESLEKDLAEYGAKRRAKFPVLDDRQMHRDRFGISDNYVWSENSARRLSVRERTDFFEYIKAQGFKLE
jgi:nitroreductase/FMN reductase [NAD(P)H]